VRVCVCVYVYMYLTREDIYIYIYKDIYINRYHIRDSQNLDSPSFYGTREEFALEVHALVPVFINMSFYIIYIYIYIYICPP
jgi:hypothetical protein